MRARPGIACPQVVTAATENEERGLKPEIWARTNGLDNARFDNRIVRLVKFLPGDPPRWIVRMKSTGTSIKVKSINLLKYPVLQPGDHAYEQLLNADEAYLLYREFV